MFSSTTRHNNTTTTNKSTSSSFDPPRKQKQVRFSPMEQVIPHSYLGGLYPLRILPDLKSARTGAPIIKRPTASDLEIFHKSLWNMVAIAEKKLDLNYTWMGDCDDDFLLDDVLRTEERIVRVMSNRRSKEDSRRSGIKLRFRVGKSFGRPRR
jgi:hypothetical protein